MDKPNLKIAFALALGLFAGCAAPPDSTDDPNSTAATSDTQSGADASSQWIAAVQGGLEDFLLNKETDEGFRFDSADITLLGKHAIANNRYDILQTSADKMAYFGQYQGQYQGRNFGITWAETRGAAASACSDGDLGFAMQIYVFTDPAIAFGDPGAQFLYGTYGVCVDAAGNTAGSSNTISWESGDGMTKAPESD